MDKEICISPTAKGTNQTEKERCIV